MCVILITQFSIRKDIVLFLLVTPYNEKKSPLLFFDNKKLEYL